MWIQLIRVSVKQRHEDVKTCGKTLFIPSPCDSVTKYTYRRTWLSDCTQKHFTIYITEKHDKAEH